MLVEIYIKPHCPYCHRAKALLQKRGIAFVEYDVSNPDDRNAIIEKTGHKTVPVVLVNGQLIGGCDDLIAADQDGTLDKLLEGQS